MTYWGRLRSCETPSIRFSPRPDFCPEGLLVVFGLTQTILLNTPEKSNIMAVAKRRPFHTVTRTVQAHPAEPS